MKLRKVVISFLVASMVFSFMSCTRQMVEAQAEHTSEENDTVQENMMEEDNATMDPSDKVTKEEIGEYDQEKYESYLEHFF